MVDGVVVLFRPAALLAADEAAVGVCVDDPPAPCECWPPAGEPRCLTPSNLRIRSRFLAFPSDIFRVPAVLGFGW